MFDILNNLDVVQKRDKKRQKYTDQTIGGFIEYFQKQAVNQITDDGNKHYHAVMLFDTEFNIGISENPYAWFNYKNVYFDNGLEALEYYANTKCPASQLVSGVDKDDLYHEMIIMINNYQNEEWLDKNLYPCL